MKTGLSGWVLAIARTLADEGVAYEHIFRQIDMDPTRLKKGNDRYSQEALSRLWQAAVAATGDAHFGLKVAAHVRPSTFHVVGYAMTCSATVDAALHRFARYVKLISNSVTVDLATGPDALRVNLSIDTGSEPPLPQTVDAVLAGVVSFTNWIVGETIVPAALHFKHAPPADPGEYTRVLRCPVYFNQTQDCIVFHAADMHRPVLAADEQLAATLDSLAISQVTQLSGRFARKVRDCLLMQLASGDLSKRATARLLNMTDRTLLRRLKDEGTTFQEVLDQLREEVASEQLRRSDVSLQEVSTMLGFSDASTFSRAFKRWTGRRPSLIQQDSRADEGLPGPRRAPSATNERGAYWDGAR
jgi:AraC-like DNA-binding protein